MDYDHVVGEKVDDIAGQRIDTGKWDRIIAEIAKCELVCANCHRIRTHMGRREADTTSPLNQAWFKQNYITVLL